MKNLAKKKLRAVLAQLSANPSLLAQHAPALCRATHVGVASQLRDVGAKVAIAEARRDELLAKCAAGEHVEIEVDLLAYEQKTGDRNRNCVRFRDGAMVSLGRTGKGTPFLRDHNQHDSLSKAGVLAASSTEKRADGDYCIYQTAKLTAPWAVEQALRGLLGAVSIGWRPTGPILCSGHGTPVWTKCYCWPGDRLAEKDDEYGGKRKVRQSDGPIVVEWIYTEAELVETSMVNIGGVPEAGAEEVRASLFASLSASNPGLGISPGADFEVLEDEESEENVMDPEQLEALKKTLGLPAAATVAEVLAAANAARTTVLEAGIQKKDLDALAEEVKTLKAGAQKRDQDAFISEALGAGKIAKGDEPMWRALHDADPNRATELMSKRADGSATPVGIPPQREGLPADELDIGEVKIPETTASVITDNMPDIYERGQRSKYERRQLALQLALAMKRLEVCPDPRARSWALAFGYEGPIKGPAPRLGATTITNNADLDPARVGFHAAFMQAMEQAAVDPVEMLFTTVPSNGNLETWNWMGDLPGFEEWITDRKMSGVEGFKLSIANKKFASGLRLKNDDIKDDKLGLLPQQISGMATKARRHRLDLILKILLNGFDGAAFPDVGTGLAYDGAFFFADAHRGGNDNNLASALDAAGLTAAELLLESMTTYDGNDPMDIHGTHLVVGPKLRAIAEKLLTQERLANGEDNYHRGKYKLIVSNRIRGTQDDWWFLGDLSQPVKPFLFQMREEISTSAVIGQDNNNSVPSFINDESWFGAQARYNAAPFEYRLLVGSKVA